VVVHQQVKVEKKEREMHVPAGMGIQIGQSDRRCASRRAIRVLGHRRVNIAAVVIVAARLVEPHLLSFVR
jgi:hypothetical protein